MYTQRLAMTQSGYLEEQEKGISKMKKTLCMIATLTITISVFSGISSAEGADDQKAVLITGASSGIGRATAEELAANGYFVYAGARKAEDIDELNKIDGIMAVRLDVTVQKVSAVEPGNYRSNIGVSRCKRMIANSEDREYVYFADVMQDYLNGCKEYIAEGGVSTETPPDRVVDAIEHALFDDSPKEHYLVVPEQFQAMITIGKSFEELLHLNQDHDHSYTRDQLIEMMDEEWAILKGEKSRDWGARE